jgi:hypothetical protein
LIQYIYISSLVLMIFKVPGLYGSSIHMYQCKQCLTRLCCKLFYSNPWCPQLFVGGLMLYLCHLYVVVSNTSWLYEQHGRCLIRCRNSFVRTWVYHDYVVSCFIPTLGDQAYLIQIYVIKCVSRNTENQKNEQHRPYQKPGVNPGPYEGVPASKFCVVMSIMIST